MSETKKRAVPAIVAGVCLLAVAAFGIVQWQKMRAIREAVEDFMANTPPGLTLKVESVEPSFFGSDIVLNKVSATYASAGAGKADYHIDTLTVTGVNAAAFRDGAGVRRWCEALSLQGVRWDYSDPVAMTMNMNVDVYILEKISGDFPLIWSETAKHAPELMRLAAVDAGAPPQSEAEARAMLGRLSGMMRAWETFGVERLAINGLRAKGDMLGKPLAFEAREYEVKGYSLCEIGPFSVSAVSGRLGAGGFEAQRISCAGVELPSYADMFMQAAEGKTPDSPLDFFAKQPLDIKKLHAEGITFNLPNWETPFSLKDAEFSLQFSDLLGLSLDMGSVEAPKSVLLDENDTLEPLEQQAFDLLPDMLSIDCGLSVSARIGKTFFVDMELKKAALSAKDVGNVSVSLAMEKIPLMLVLQGDAPQGLVKYLEVSLTDIKLLDIALLLTSDGTGRDEALDTGALREQYARMAEGNAGLYPDEARKKLCVDMARLLRQPGGTLKVRLEPKQPLSMLALPMLVQTDPSLFSLSSSFVPGQ